MEGAQQLHGTVHGDGTVVQRGAEVFLKHRAVEVYLQGAEHVVPANLLQLAERQSPRLDLVPQLAVLPVEYLLHVRLVGAQTEVGEALRHRLPDIGVKVQKGVVDVDEDHGHGRYLSDEEFTVQGAAQGLAHGDHQQHGTQHHTCRQRVERPQERVVQSEGQIQQVLHQHRAASGQY